MVPDHLAVCNFDNLQRPGLVAALDWPALPVGLYAVGGRGHQPRAPAADAGTEQSPADLDRPLQPQVVGQLVWIASSASSPVSASMS